MDCRKISALAFIGIMGCCAPAQAQAVRTWVSGLGDDANPCSRTAPCKTFAGAISKTAAAGEINCLDPGGFGLLTITKSITILCQGVIGSVVAAGTDALKVSAGAADIVVIDGLDIEGLNAGLNGINVLSASQVFIRNTTIRHFTQDGVVGNVAGGARIEIADSYIVNNGGGGFNAGMNAGLSIRTLYDNNANFAVRVNAPGSLFLSGNTMLGSTDSIKALGGAAVTSFGDNALGGAGAPTKTIPLK